MIVQSLRAIQNRFGFLPDRELVRFSQESGVALARIEEVASFFPGFRQERDRPAVIEVRVCRDMTCHLRGASALLAPDGLPQLCDDAALQVALHERGPAWSAAERQRARDAGTPIELPDPPPDRCRVTVEGVSCLGRCDRAPAVWVERHPMPAGEHAWVYARRDGESPDAFRDRIIHTVRTIAADGEPDPDTDAAYRPHTNADVRFELPVVRPPAADHPPLPSPGWEIDPYHGRPRDYAAVRLVAEFLRDRGGLPPYPTPDELRERYPALADDKLRQARFLEDANKYLPELRAAGLQGMGGAGEPTFDKWLKLWQGKGTTGDKYVVVNGDESEPGTFKDRELLLRTPHLVVEGVILAGLMTGATAASVFIRHEYHEQIHAVRDEIARARRLGACGADVFGSGMALPVDVFESPGGYICGEQSALIEAMQDHRAQPRPRPPELQTNGLWDQPTVVNNVETMAWVPAIILRGGGEYAKAGYAFPVPPDRPRVAWFKGRRLFSVSGDVRRPGVYEVPTGIPLGEVLDGANYCGGVLGELYAVAPSGPSSGLAPAVLPLKLPPDRAGLDAWIDALLGKMRKDKAGKDDTDRMERVLRANLVPGAAGLDIRAVPMDLGFFRAMNGPLGLRPGLALGAGLAVYAAGADALAQAVNFTRFYRNESCGKCVPCRIGSQKLLRIGSELLRRRDAGTLAADEPAAVAGDVGVIHEALGQTSICGLGQIAALPLTTVLKYFPVAITTPTSRPPCPTPPT